MQYLIDCVCGHDLTRHDQLGCHGNDWHCACARTRSQALESAIEQARINPWARYLRETDGSDAPPDVART
jgi:hypothetical protein